MSAPYRVGLVACSASKLRRAAPARYLYTGDLFSKASRLAEKTCDTWVILSALHGVVDPDTVLEPYNYTLPEKDTDAGVLEQLPGRSRVTRHWPLNTYHNRLTSSLVRRRWFASQGVTLVGFAPRRYLGLLDREERWDLEQPLQGMGIGQQKAWLAGQFAGPRPPQLGLFATGPDQVAA